MNRASSATGWVRNPVMKSPDLDPTQASSYELGWTHNPITGCLNSCPYCYARKLANTRLKKTYLANELVAVDKGGSRAWADDWHSDPFYPRFWPERLIEPMHKYRRWGKHNAVLHEQSPKGIFTCDMSDLFGIGIPEEWTLKVMDAIKKSPQHRFYLLTKQPQELQKWSPFPDNCYVGVTATNEEQYFKACAHLDMIKASVKYISFEPLLERIAVRGKFDGHLDWIILGAQTKPYKPPKIEWVREIVEAADRAGTPVFLKDNLLELVNYEGEETEFAFNKDGQYRQEGPE